MLRVYACVLVAVMAATACSGGGRDAACEPAPDDLVAAVAAGLSVEADLADAWVVPSDDFANIYFLSARLNGSAADGQTGTWATNDLEPTASVFAIDETAVETSAWALGASLPNALTMETEGAEASRTCLG